MSQTAMLLTQEEWSDVARMVKHYCLCTEWVNHGALSPTEDANARDIRRCRVLAKRIMDAAE